jgi:hypothetical protein
MGINFSLSNLEQQLLQDRLFEVIKADRLDDDVAIAANDVPAIVYVEAFGRLWRKNIFGRLYDDWQAIDDHAFANQFIANLMKTDDTLVIIAVSGNIDDLSAANAGSCSASRSRSLKHRPRG